jgi:hypothetical protein
LSDIGPGRLGPFGGLLADCLGIGPGIYLPVCGLIVGGLVDWLVIFQPYNPTPTNPIKRPFGGFFGLSMGWYRFWHCAIVGRFNRFTVKKHSNTTDKKHSITLCKNTVELG